MASLIGYYSLIIGFSISFLIIFFSIKNLSKSKLYNKIIFSVFFQFFFVSLSFLCLVQSFISSDFSNETVFNHSHTTVPTFYKISDACGNHEGSLLLWLLVLTLFIFLLLLRSNDHPKKYSPH